MDNYLGTWLPWIIWEKFRFYDYHGGGRGGEINSKDNNDLGLEKIGASRYHVSLSSISF